ncbi:MAG: DNA-directed RNA polymerase subunit P [Nanoarchaeota archaeon]
MSEYKCFSCNKTISEANIKKKVRCIYCGSKMIFKSRITITKVKAR